MKAYLIPGWGEGLQNRNYQEVLDVYKQAGYEPEFLSITWNRKTIEDWVEEVKAKLSKQELQNSLLSGFSFGAVTAFSLAATYQNPKRLLLFSLSSYYKGDNPKPAWLKDIGKARTSSFKAINFQEFAARIKCPTDVFVGTKEGPEMLHRANETKKFIKNSSLHIVKGASHDVTNPKYLDLIKSALRSK